METVILCFFILCNLYLIFLLGFVYKWDFRSFLSLPPKKESLPAPNPEVKQEIEILGKTEVKFLDKLPEREPIKPKWEVSLEKEENKEEDKVVEAGPENNTLSQEEQQEIMADQDKHSYWEDDDPSKGFSIDDIHHAAETIAGQRTSDSDIVRTQNTLKHFSEEWIEILSLHATNDKRIKDMLSEYLDKPKDNQSQKTKLKDFIVTDHIA